MKKCFLLVTALVMAFASNAQIKPDTTCLYAVKDSDSLYLDVYYPENHVEDSPVILYIFGGGFAAGSRADSLAVVFYQHWVDNGYPVVAIDYRLGLKGKKNVRIMKLIKEDNPVPIAVADLFSATKYLIDNKTPLRLNTDKIVLVGSSAGAITSLTGEFDLIAGRESAKVLPEGFGYAGVISFSGAVFSDYGRLEYDGVCPIMLLHGTADKIVTYNTIRFFKYGLYGTKYVSKHLSGKHKPNYTVRVEDEGHAVAMALNHYFENALWFVENMVREANPYFRDETIADPVVWSWNWGRNLKTKDIYK